METKRCTRCKQLLPVGEFYLSSKGYYSSKCKECAKIISKAEYKKLTKQDKMVRSFKYKVRYHSDEAFREKVLRYHKDRYNNIKGV